MEIPDEVLCKGWVHVLAFLLELEEQESTPVREARVFLLGEGKQGKTRLRGAFLDEVRNVTDPIADDDRTVSIETKVCHFVAGRVEKGTYH